MKIETARFGALEVDPAQIFTFPMGLLGFAALKSFVIVERERHHFKWLQSLDDAAVAFVLGDPLSFYPGYRAEIKRAELQALAPLEERDLVLSVIMTVASRPEEVSANLCAPLIFNLANRRAMQYVLNDQRYPVKYFVFKGAAAGAPAPSPSNSGERLDPRSLSLR